MKKQSMILLGIIIMFALAGCSSQSPLQKATETNVEQANAIEAVLEECNIEWELVSKAEIDTEEDELVARIASIYLPYDIVDVDGNKYRMILNADDLTVQAIVDIESQEIIYGSVF